MRIIMAAITQCGDTAETEAKSHGPVERCQERRQGREEGQAVWPISWNEPDCGSSKPAAHQESNFADTTTNSLTCATTSSFAGTAA